MKNFILVQQQVLKSIFLSLSTLLIVVNPAWAEAPYLKIKTGVSNITITAGDLITSADLKSMITFQPTVLWSFPSFSSRIGVHYLQELNSPYGLTPISGIGISGYYHILGITTVYEEGMDDVLIQKSKPGPYVVGTFTPVNVNLNRFQEDGGTNNFYLSAFVNEYAFGLGYDYPFWQNMIVSGELLYRTGTNVGNSTQKIAYKGTTIFISIGTSYY